MTVTTFRPVSLDDFTGQQALKEHLAIVLGSAKIRGQVPDHMLFAGPPGLGKTTLANIVAAELGTEAHVVMGPALEKPSDLASILTKLETGDVLFIDEIHRLPRAVEEVLYSAMEDFRLDVVVGTGSNASSVSLYLPPFTLIGATTLAGLLSAPLRDRFGIVGQFNFYSVEELRKVVFRSARLLGADITPDGAYEIARRSRGTPRVANKLLRRVRDYAVVNQVPKIDRQTASAALTVFGIDDIGLNEIDREILSVLCSHQRPVGLSTLAVMVGEDAGTIEEVYEPYLVQQGLIQRTPRGRTATEAAYRHLGE